MAENKKYLDTSSLQNSVGHKSLFFQGFGLLAIVFGNNYHSFNHCEVHERL